MTKLVVCTKTGTILSADSCVLLDTSGWDDGAEEAFEALSDSEFCELAREHGEPIV